MILLLYLKSGHKLLLKKYFLLPIEMQLRNHNITFRKLGYDEELPYELLLLADPSRHLVDKYLKQSEIFIATIDEEILGVFVLYPYSKESVEIKNIAVKPGYQGKGIGKMMIENAIQIATSKNQKSIYIGTANSSIGQLNLYKKLGFEVKETKKDYFMKNYPEPIFENGIQAKDIVLLTKLL